MCGPEAETVGRGEARRVVDIRAQARQVELEARRAVRLVAGRAVRAEAGLEARTAPQHRAVAGRIRHERVALVQGRAQRLGQVLRTQRGHVAEQGSRQPSRRCRRLPGAHGRVEPGAGVVDDERHRWLPTSIARRGRRSPRRRGSDPRCRPPQRSCHRRSPATAVLGPSPTAGSRRDLPSAVCLTGMTTCQGWSAPSRPAAREGAAPPESRGRGRRARCARRSRGVSGGWLAGGLAHAGEHRPTRGYAARHHVVRWTR